MANIHAKILGRKGGKSKSLAKQLASRRNGKLGGRPKKSIPVLGATDMKAKPKATE